MNDDPSQSYSPGIYEGGPAFPQTADSWYRRANGDGPAPSGMTIRDVFAGLAMQSVAKLEADELNSALDSAAARSKILAHAAYIYADAMLLERSLTKAPEGTPEISDSTPSAPTFIDTVCPHGFTMDKYCRLCEVHPRAYEQPPRIVTEAEIHAAYEARAISVGSAFSYDEGMRKGIELAGGTIESRKESTP